MENKKVTAVEWFVHQIEPFLEINKELGTQIIKQAKAMEKEHIINAFLDGKINNNKDWAIEYYNETYNNGL